MAGSNSQRAAAGIVLFNQNAPWFVGGNKEKGGRVGAYYQAEGVCCPAFIGHKRVELFCLEGIQRGSGRISGGGNCKAGAKD